MSRQHGYGLYTDGCRCKLCVEARRVHWRVQKYNRYWALKAQERAS